MSASRKRALREAQQKRESGGFIALPFAVVRSPELAGLGPHAVKLLFDLLQQYNLRNNGDFSMSFEKGMRARGWKSKQTLNKARLELLESGFIVISRQGGLHQCSLYAVTFFSYLEPYFRSNECYIRSKKNAPPQSPKCAAL